VPGADVARRIGWAMALVRDADDDTLLDLVDGLVGTGVATQEAVPAAFAIASRAATDPWRAALLGARLGGDSDTIAAMAAAMVGACTGLSALPAAAVDQVRRVNDLQFEPLVDDLLRLREAQ
jgi:ADP-ribosylglycohydrolase